MPEIFWTSDLHVSHKNIILYEPKVRGHFRTADGQFDTHAMNEEIIKRYNAVVTPEDTVWLLGDFKMMLKVESPTPYVARLNGHKKLVIGNHDHIFKKHSKELDWPATQAFWLAAGFEEVYREYILEHGGKKIYMAHAPAAYQFWRGADFQFCGHVHSQWAKMPAGPNAHNCIINVGVDVSNLTPLTFDQLMKRDV
jgi:calcineurin-like phosphoesterase family protein